MCNREKLRHQLWISAEGNVGVQVNGCKVRYRQEGEVWRDYKEREERDSGKEREGNAYQNQHWENQVS
jgi:hypothetical protein